MCKDPDGYGNIERIYDFGLMLDWEGGLSAALWFHICLHFLSISWKLRLGKVSIEVRRMLPMCRSGRCFTLHGRLEAEMDRKKGIPVPMHNAQLRKASEVTTQAVQIRQTHCRSVSQKSRELRETFKNRVILIRASAVYKCASLPTFLLRLPITLCSLGTMARED
jgi:hypothetical protein